MKDEKENEGTTQATKTDNGPRHADRLQPLRLALVACRKYHNHIVNKILSKTTAKTKETPLVFGDVS